jgi:hypothetical protein
LAETGEAGFSVRLYAADESVDEFAGGGVAAQVSRAYSALIERAVDGLAKPCSQILPTDVIKRANPASWKHVNLYGAYSFLDIGDEVDLQELVNLLEAARGRDAAAPD